MKPFASCSWGNPEEIFDLTSDEEEIYEIYEIYPENEMNLPDVSLPLEEAQVIEQYPIQEPMDIGGEVATNSEAILNMEAPQSSYRHVDSKPVVANLVVNETMPFAIDNSYAFEADTTSKMEYFFIAGYFSCKNHYLF